MIYDCLNEVWNVYIGMYKIKKKGHV